ncbi:MAG TPA: PRC-barrel domain-containing protein [Methylocella sp.]|nr:PRC-barrel domain-containing protein [Methylocella sp.]
MVHRLRIALVASAAMIGVALAQSPTATPGVQFMSVPADATLGYNLIGLNVYNGAQENVGEIKDLAIVKDKLDGYILSVGGFLGMGQHYVAVKPDSIAINYDQAKKKWMASINATKDELKSAPEFKYEGRWNAS